MIIPYLFLLTGILILLVLAVVEIVNEIGLSVQIITGRDDE